MPDMTVISWKINNAPLNDTHMLSISAISNWVLATVLASVACSPLPTVMMMIVLIAASKCQIPICCNGHIVSWEEEHHWIVSSIVSNSFFPSLNTYGIGRYSHINHLNSLNSTSIYGRRCKHLNVPIYLTQLHTKLRFTYFMHWSISNSSQVGCEIVLDICLLVHPELLWVR